MVRVSTSWGNAASTASFWARNGSSFASMSSVEVLMVRVTAASQARPTETARQSNTNRTGRPADQANHRHNGTGRRAGQGLDSGKDRRWPGGAGRMTPDSHGRKRERTGTGQG